MGFFETSRASFSSSVGKDGRFFIYEPGKAPGVHLRTVLNGIRLNLNIRIAFSAADTK